ncbi:MAG: hypothetical protein PHD72_04215 [Patescibacteria group bacterium]|nr:hypothetical protein [Patescibacteria group bacterium]
MPALITIKKPDGSTEKITLEEFKRRPAFASLRRGEQIVQAPPAPTVPVVVRTTLPPKNAEAKSLLEEELPKKNDGAPLKSADKKKEAEEIFKKLNFNFLAPDTANRLRGLLQLRLKDLRSEDELKEWLLMPVSEMGIGLREPQAETVLKLCRERMLEIGRVPASAAPLKSPLGTPKPLMKEGPEPLQKYTEPPVPTTGAPFNSFVHKSEPAKEVRNLNELAKMQIKDSGIDVATGKKEEPARPIVRDIQPARPREMGPVDEIKYFSTVDFRRLSADPSEAAARLKQKFVNLRDESYILFLEAMEVWKRSPFFLDYIGRVTYALNNGKKLSEATVDKNTAQMNEISAIIQMEKELV